MARDPHLISCVLSVAFTTVDSDVVFCGYYINLELSYGHLCGGLVLVTLHLLYYINLELSYGHLCATSQGLVLVTFICVASSVSSLSARETPLTLIEQLRFDTRSPTGWILLLTIVSLPIILVLFIFRFLDFTILVNYRKIILIVVSHFSTFLALLL